MEIVALVLVALSVIILLRAIRIVPQGREYTVERFGRYTAPCRPALPS